LVRCGALIEHTPDPLRAGGIDRNLDDVLAVSLQARAHGVEHELGPEAIGQTVNNGVEPDVIDEAVDRPRLRFARCPHQGLALRRYAFRLLALCFRLPLRSTLGLKLDIAAVQSGEPYLATGELLQVIIA
jgi:hypothetical protein